MNSGLINRSDNMGHIRIEIDGKIFSVMEGANLLQAARENGIDIPGLCYHRKLTPTGACRLCVVKIRGQQGLVMSCTVTVKEGMEITAFDAETEEMRKHTIEYLLAEHNDEDDGTYSDELKILAGRYNLDLPENRNYRNIHREIGYGKDLTSPVLEYDASKCIKCFRCIKGCEEVQGKGVLSFSERGIHSRIIAGLGIWNESECDGCGECIQLCPTGALVEKPNRDTIDMTRISRKVITTCPYCGVGCQMELIIQDGRIVRANGVEGILPNDGRLCIKGRFGYNFVNDPGRLVKPLLKVDGVFKEIEWDEALNIASDRFAGIKEKYGKESLAGYSSAKCTNEENYLFQKFVRIVFGTNNLDYCTRLCHASTVTAMLRSIGDGAASNSIQDFELTDCLFVTGNNMIETHPVTATYVKAGKRRGQKLIVCDPKWTPLVKYADIWLQPRLGTDVALLNGMINVIISEDLVDEKFINERVVNGLEAFSELKEVAKDYTPEEVESITNVPADLIRQAARIYATSKTAIIATGMGMSQQVVGTNNVFALINMMLITGQIGREYAGLCPPRGQNNVQGATDVGCSPIYFPGYIPIINDENRARVAAIWNVDPAELSGKPGLSTVEIVNAAHEGKIKGMYIMGENPMVTDPDLNHTEEGLKNLDFLVVQDIFLTETAKLAHLVLPASSFAEKDGTFVNSDRRVLRVRKAVDLPGEARSDSRILLDIAARTGYNIGNYASDSEIFDEIAKAAPIMAGISWERIENQGIQWPCTDKEHPGTGTLFTERFNTPTGKAKLNPVRFAEQSERPSEEFPYILNTGRILYHYHSSTMSRKSTPLNRFANDPYVLINHSDLIKTGLKDGDRVRVWNKRGELISTLRASNEVAQGELFMPWHYSESPVNSLTRSELDPYSKIAPFKLSACNIELL
jgi:formate dehydrogenase alpha subunit